jgi:ribosomal protein L11
VLPPLRQRLNLQLQLSQHQRGAPVEPHLGQRGIRVCRGGTPARER